MGRATRFAEAAKELGISEQTLHRWRPGIPSDPLDPARERLLLPVEDIVGDLNRFLDGWAGYFRYGNSAESFDPITFHTVNRLAIFVAKRHRRDRRFGWWAVARQSPDRYGLIDLNGTIVPPRPFRPRHRGR